MITQWDFNSINVDNFDVLTLDCFDTLHHRVVDKPIDVFTFVYGSPFGRVEQESNARKRNYVTRGCSEVTISEFKANYTAELNAEKQMGFKSQAILDLITRFRAQGKPVIIVSDIYYTAKDLKQLVGNLDVEIITSCDHGYNKGQGLFDIVKDKYNLEGKRVVHIGDNYNADIVAAQKAGFAAIHYQGYQEEALDLLEQLKKTYQQEFKGMPKFEIKKGLLELKFTSDLELFGFMLVGPIVDHFMDQIYKQLKKRTATFFGRDAYVPHELFKGSKQYISINRKMAWQCSFYTEKDVLDYLISSATALPVDRIDHLLHDLDEFDRTFKDNVNKWAMTKLETILKRSAIQREHLKRHLATLDLTNMLMIDMGYSGTINKRLNIILKNEYDISPPPSLFILAHPTSGLPAAFKVEDELANKLLENVALLETILKSDVGPLLTYDDQGLPVSDNYEWGDVQRTIVDAIRRGMLVYLNKHVKTSHPELYLTHLLLNPPTCMGLLCHELGLGTQVYSKLAVKQ